MGSKGDESWKKNFWETFEATSQLSTTRCGAKQKFLLSAPFNPITHSQLAKVCVSPGLAGDEVCALSGSGFALNGSEGIWGSEKKTKM